MKLALLIVFMICVTFISLAGIEYLKSIQVEHLRIQGEIIRRYIERTPQHQQPSIEIKPGMRGA